MAHYAIVVDLDRCIGCHGCEIACKNENNIALGEYWNKVVERGPFGEYPDLEMYFLPTMCQQCQDAPCVNVCPTGASYRDADGMVLVDKEKCIGCKYCMMACPYGVRSWNAAESVVENYIDSAVMAKLGTVTIIHGKGTGALRKAVHEMLKRNKAVKSFRLGRYGEGESGVTVVEFK